jgi:hypothetical protein
MDQQINMFIMFHAYGLLNILAKLVVSVVHPIISHQFHTHGTCLEAVRRLFGNIALVIDVEDHAGCC